MKTSEITKKLRSVAKKYRTLLIVIAAGLLLLLLPNGRESSAPQTVEQEHETFELERFERRVEQALERMSGVGKAEVVLTLSSTMETVYQTNVKSSSSETSQSAERSTVMANAGSGVQSAVVASRVYPQFRGALIVCEGAANAAVRLEVTRAVASLTGLTSDRITVTRGAD